MVKLKKYLCRIDFQVTLKAKNKQEAEEMAWELYDEAPGPYGNGPGMLVKRKK